MININISNLKEVDDFLFFIIFLPCGNISSEVIFDTLYINLLIQILSIHQLFSYLDPLFSPECSAGSLDP